MLRSTSTTRRYTTAYSHTAGPFMLLPIATASSATFALALLPNYLPAAACHSPASPPEDRDRTVMDMGHGVPRRRRSHHFHHLCCLPPCLGQPPPPPPALPFCHPPPLALPHTLPLAFSYAMLSLSLLLARIMPGRKTILIRVRSRIHWPATDVLLAISGALPTLPAHLYYIPHLV